MKQSGINPQQWFPHMTWHNAKVFELRPFSCPYETGNETIPHQKQNSSTSDKIKKQHIQFQGRVGGREGVCVRVCKGWGGGGGGVDIM